jgi:hypothetical protein
MTRPCRWPDGGCGEQIIDVVTVKGAKQVLDATPVNAIVMVFADWPDRLHVDTSLLEGRAKVVPTYVDHHATCSAWAAKVERERAAKAVGS